MEYEIKISIDGKTPISSNEMQIVVNRDSEMLGILKMRGEMINWSPKTSKDGKASEMQLTWEQFTELLEFTANRKDQLAAKRTDINEPIPVEIGASTPKMTLNHPMPATKAALGMKLLLNEEEFALTRKAAIGESMDSTWLINFDDIRQELTFHHRSTGNCIYLLRFKRCGDETEVCESWVNRDQNQYRESSIDYDLEVALWLIDFHLLHKLRDFPTKSRMF